MKTRLCLISFVFIFTLSFYHSSAQISENKIASINDILNQWEGENPGLAIGISHKNKLIFTRGIGKANLETGIAIDSQTQFHIASMTKQFIGAAIGLLYLEDKLSLEDRIDKYLPQLSHYPSEITVRDLLQHTSGIRDYSNLMSFRKEQVEAFIPLSDAIHLLTQQQALNFPTGTAYSYSNSNYLLLAQIINEVSGMDFREYVTQKILQPLKMKQTYFVEDTAINPDNTALPYFKNRDGTYQRDTKHPLAGKDQMISTIEDLALWDQNFQTLTVGGAELKELLLSEGYLTNGEKIDYHFGLQKGLYQGLTTISHGGNMSGFNCQYVQFPQEETSIIILANAAHINASGISYRIADILFKEKLQTQANNSPLKVLPGFSLSKKELKTFIGSYWNTRLMRDRVVYLRDDTLRYNRPDNYESPLVPVGKNQFRMLNAKKAQTANIVFVFNDQKPKELIYQSPRGNPVSMLSFQPPNYGSKDLKRFSSKFYSKELDINYELNINQKHLFLWINHQSIARLIPMKPTVFKSYWGTFEFMMDAAGELTGFYLTQERARKVWFEKVND